MGVLIVFSAIDWEEEFAKNIAILHPGIGHFHGRVFAAELVGTFIFISLIDNEVQTFIINRSCLSAKF